MPNNIASKYRKQKIDRIKEKIRQIHKVEIFNSQKYLENLDKKISKDMNDMNNLSATLI